MLILFIFLIGLFIGSFLNVLADRLPRDETALKGRSHCENCKHTLAWYDLIPVLSFIFIGGKCRYCRSPLSYYYPVVELTTGILFVLTIFHISDQLYPIPYTLYALLIVSSLIVIFFADLKYGIIPDKITYPAIVISFIYLLYATPYTLYANFLSGAGSFLLFFFLFAVTRGRGMGFGDVKLVFLMGLFLGFPNIVIALYIAFLTGAVVSLILIAWGKKRLKGSTIPFGPFLVLGAIISLFWGEIIAQHMLSFLLR